MTEYNSTEFDPPAPVAYVTLRNGDTGLEWSDAPMQLDSGADITLIPQEAVKRLNLTIVGLTQLGLKTFLEAGFKPDKLA